ncbi:MAG: alpha/beta fold hydrolase [Kiritimatiellae bacterium]|nr:alpha/beta fold hydrolase [Kiritimatiellia bacterium]
MNREIEEEVALLRAGDEVLHSVLYSPPAPAKGAILFCHPLVEERKSAHRIMVEAARACAADGLVVLRFDYRGCGDSTGEFEKCSVCGWLDDISQVFEFLRARAPARPVGLLGLRLGAALAMRFAADISASETAAEPEKCHRPPPDFLVLWEPVWNCRSYLEDLFRKKLVREMMTGGRSRSTRNGLLSDMAAGRSVDLDGYPFSPRLYGELEALSPTSLIRGLRLPMFCIHIARSNRIPREATDAISALVETNPVSSFRIVAEPPFWNTIGVVQCPETIRSTVEWIGSVCDRSQFGHSTAKPIASKSPPLHASKNEKPLEEPVSFKSDGLTIRGILHWPTKSVLANPSGIIFLHGWAGSRLGPHDMFVHAARHFARLGFTCLRFDFRGRGDSEGNTLAATIDSMTADAIAAARFFSDGYGVDHLFLVGICSGCKVAIAAATGLAGIRGLVLWSAEAMGPLRTSASRKRKAISAFRTYLTKFCQPSTWRKLLLGRVNTALVREAITGREAPTSREIVRETEILLRFRMWKGNILFVYGSQDPEFASATAYERFCRENRIPCSIHVVAGANHNFYSLEWERAVIERTSDWLAPLVQ